MTRHGEIDQVILRIQGLVEVRDLLAARGASEAELEEHSAELGRMQWRLARLVRERTAPANLAA